MAYYCPNCGEPVKNADHFCQSCGVKLIDEPVDIEELRRTHTVSSGNVQFQEQVNEQPVMVEESDPYEEYRKHTFDYQGSRNQSQDNKWNRSASYTYEQSGVEYFTNPSWPVRNRIAAGVLAILLGQIGVHKFYLGKYGQGILMLLFCWTGIPAIIGLIQGIIYLTQSDAEFCSKNQVRVQ